MGNRLSLVVPAELDGERLDKVLADMLGISRSVARRLVESGVTVDGRDASPGDRLGVGASVITPQPPEEGRLEPEEVEFGVLYEDAAIVVVDKPPGLVVHPGSANRTGTLASGLLHRYPEIAGVGASGRWGLVHRLDRDTSGVLLVARTSDAFESLVSELRARKITRQYLALVSGMMKPPTGTIDAPIGRDDQTPTRRAVTRGGKWARTHYRVVENFPTSGCALVEVKLETGRTHQIRVHFAAIGHHVVGDETYGSGKEVIEVPRIFLHAARLAFTHPVSGEQMVVEAPLPDDLARVVAALEAVESA